MKIKQALVFFLVSFLIISCGSTSSSTGSNTSTGSTGNTFTGSISGDKYENHKVAFRANQVLTVSLEATNKSCYFNLLTSSGEAIHNGSMDGNKFSGTMSSDGYYTIRVYLMGAANSNNEKVNYTVRYTLK